MSRSQQGQSLRSRSSAGMTRNSGVPCCFSALLLCQIDDAVYAIRGAVCDAGLGAVALLTERLASRVVINHSRCFTVRIGQF